MKLGQCVKQVITTPITGTIVEGVLRGDGMTYLVDAVDANGNHATRYFHESQIEPDPEAQAIADAAEAEIAAQAAAQPAA